MAVAPKQLSWYSAAVAPENDTTTAIGGAIDLTRKPEFIDLTGLVQIASSAAATATVTITYRTSTGSLTTEVKTLNGTTAVTYTASMSRILKALKSATTTGDVCIEAQTATLSNTAQAGAVDTMTLNSGASATDDFYNGMVLRTTGGTGPNQIRQIIDYIGATKVAHVSRDWGTTPSATTTFRISPGMVFDKSPSEIMEVRRIFYAAASEPLGGATSVVHVKIFVKNTSASDFQSALVHEGADPSGLVTFGVAATLDDTGTNGSGNNRLVAPAGITFDSADKAMANGGVLTAGAAQGVWLALTLAAGAAAQSTSYTITADGETV